MEWNEMKWNGMKWNEMKWNGTRTAVWRWNANGSVAMERERQCSDGTIHRHLQT